MCLIYIAEMQVVGPPLATTVAHRVIPAHCSDSGWRVVVEVGSGGRGSSSGGIGCRYKLRSPVYERQWPRECVLGPSLALGGALRFQFHLLQVKLPLGIADGCGCTTGNLEACCYPWLSRTERSFSKTWLQESTEVKTGWLNTGQPVLLFLSAFKSRTSTVLPATASL